MTNWTAPDTVHHKDPPDLDLPCLLDIVSSLQYLVKKRPIPITLVLGAGAPK